MRLLRSRCLIPLPRKFLALIFVACWTHGSLVSAAQPQWKLDSYLSLSTGDYGEDEETGMLYWPIAAKHLFAWGEIGITIPYVEITAPGALVIVDGVVESVDAGESNGRETHAGLGDIVMKVEYEIREADSYWPWIDLTARLKIPTASADAGLGTGETDFGIGVETVKTLNDSYLLFLDIGYTVIGDPSGVDYDNRWMVSPGIGRYYTPELMLAVFYEWRNAIGSGDDPHGLSCLTYYKWQSGLRTYAMLDFGLSDGAADLGLTAGVQWRF